MADALLSLDFGGTLDGSGVAPCERRWAFYRAAGFRFDRDRLRRAHVAARDRLLGDPDAPQWTLEERVGAWFRFETEYLAIPDRRLPRWVEEFAVDERARLAAAAAPLSRLASRYPLAVVSNNVGNVEQVLRNVGLLPFFTVVIDSAVCGYRKPDPRIFLDCQRRVGVRDPRRCWHVGDEWDKDVVGALAANWHAVLFVPPGTSAMARRRENVPFAETIDGFGEIVTAAVGEAAPADKPSGTEGVLRMYGRLWLE